MYYYYFFFVVLLSSYSFMCTRLMGRILLLCVHTKQLERAVYPRVDVIWCCEL
jgi:hypothetical protein